MCLKYLTFLVFFCYILSCDEDNSVNVVSQDFTADFDSVWTKFDEKYPLFEYKGIDWAAVSQKYRNQFSLISLEERNNKLIEIFKIFKDAHIYIKTPSQDIIGQYKPPNFTINFNEQFLTDFIDSLDWHKESDFWGWGNKDNVGYIRITGLHVGSMDITNFDKAMDSLMLTNGIILDIRRLTGGNLILTEDVWNRFIDQKITVGYQLYRNGWEHDDADTISVITNPRKEWQYIKKVVVLIGQSTFSIGEIFAETMSHFTHATLIGDTTFGGVEAPFLYMLSEGTEYSVPIVAYLNTEKEPLEWKGVIPDIYFDPMESVNNSTKDIVLEEAFKLINQNAYNKMLYTEPSRRR